MNISKDRIISFIKVFTKIGLICLILASIFILNVSVLLSPDDYNYTWVQGDNMNRVSSIEDCIRTGRFFYNNWTGRVIPHVLIGIFRNINPLVYQIANTTMFMIFIIVLTKVFDNGKSSYLSILAAFGYLAFSKMFGEKFAWLSGSFNYLWPSAFLLLWLYYFYNYIKGDKHFNKIQATLLILASFIVGVMHENTAFIGGSFVISLVLFKFKDFLKFKKSKKIVVILTILLFGIGALLNIFAPGNLIRAGSENAIKGFSFKTCIDNYVENIIPIGLTIISMIVILILENKELVKKEKFGIFKIKNWKEIDFKIVSEEIKMFIIPTIIATIPMGIIGYFPLRAFLPYEMMFIIIFAYNIKIIFTYFEKYNKSIALISILLTLIVFGHFSPSTLADIRYIIPYKNKITMECEEAAASGEKDVLISEFEYLNWIHREDYINIDNFFPEFVSGMPVNVLMSIYYGFDKVTAIKESDYLIEIKVDTEGLNNYHVTDINTEANIYTMEYDNLIRYTVPKDKLGVYLLDCRNDDTENLILDYRVRYIGGELSKEDVSLDKLIIK